MPSVTNSTTAFYQRSLNQMGDLRALAENLQLQVSTGERLTKSSDDPVASARLRSLSRTDRLAQIDADNAARASDELSTGAAAMEDVANIMIRARELAQWAGNDTTSATERELIATEIEQLRETLFATANGLSNTGRSLFGGEVPDFAYSMDGAGVVTYAGTASSGSIDIGEGVSIDRALTGPDIFNFIHNGVPTDAFAFLANLANDLRTAADPAAAARDSFTGFDASIDTLGRAQAIYGARLTWVDTIQQTQVLRAESRAEEGGEIGGTNLADAITRLQQTLTVLEASQASFARVSNLTLFNSI